MEQKATTLLACAMLPDADAAEALILLNRFFSNMYWDIKPEDETKVAVIAVGHLSKNAMMPAVNYLAMARMGISLFEVPDGNFVQAAEDYEMPHYLDQHFFDERAEEELAQQVAVIIAQLSERFLPARVGVLPSAV